MIPTKAYIDDWAAGARSNPWFRWGVPAAALIAILDQLLKYWIVHVVELPAKRKIEISAIFDVTYVENRGASFGMMAGGTTSRIILSSISIAVATALVIWLGRLKRRFAAIGAILIIGGALGNLYDRIAYGYVVDFLDFSGLYFPWVFNIADAAINVGVGCLIVDALTHKSETRKD
ncbi:MAG: signal peptidase II [Parvularculaceae bacterium]